VGELSKQKQKPQEKSKDSTSQLPAKKKEQERSPTRIGKLQKQIKVRGKYGWIPVLDQKSDSLRNGLEQLKRDYERLLSKWFWDLKLF